MAFLFKKKKGKKKLRTQASIEVLDRLNGYLDENTVEPVKFLVGFWKDQEDAFTYKEIRQAILDGALSEETMRLWMQDYSIMVSERMYPVWQNAMVAGSLGQPVMDAFAADFAFDLNTPSVLSWLNERGAEFVTSVADEQKRAIKAMLMQKVNGAYTVDELSRVIRPCIGLTESQAKANLRYYNTVKTNLLEQHPKMKPESVRNKAREAAIKYAERQHRQRAFDIAQTEMAFAYNRGADEGIRQAQGQNLLGVMEKRWSTSGDENVCDICRGLDGVQIQMDDDFDFKGKLLFAGQKRTPPAHPRCACAVQYIEVGSRSGAARPGATSAGGGVEEVELEYIGDIDVEKLDMAIGYYNEQIRAAENEIVVAIDKTGEVFYAQGGKSGIRFKDRKMSGSIVIHNHPVANGVVSFGKDDFDFLQKHQDIKQLIAVNPYYTYTVEVSKDISNISYYTYYHRAMQAGEPDNPQYDTQHKVFEFLAEEGYVKYGRKRAD